jgi:hypothetical protein
MPSPPAFHPRGGCIRPLPRRHEIELPVFLHEVHGLVDHALELLVIAHLDIARGREVLAQRVPAEAVIGEDAAQVRVAGEQDPEHVVDLALVPAGAGMRGHDGGDHVFLPHMGFHADAVVLVHAEEVVDHVEAPLPLGPVDAGDVDQRGKGAGAVGLQELHETVDLGDGDLDGQLAMGDRVADHGIGLLVRDMGGEFLQRLGHGVVSCLGAVSRTPIGPRSSA